MFQTQNAQRDFFPLVCLNCRARKTLLLQVLIEHTTYSTIPLLFFVLSFVDLMFLTQKAAVQRKKEDASREEQEQIDRWASTLTKVLDMRCDGVTDEAVWKEVGGREGGGDRSMGGGL